MTAIVRSESWDVDRRLSDFDLTRPILIDIVKACVAGHGGCTDNDPPGARGYESYRFGTRYARDILRPAGWHKDNGGNFCSIVNHNRRFKMVVMNADGGAGLPDRVPQNRCKKGPHSERVAAANQTWLFAPEDIPLPGPEGLANENHGYTTWHLCVFNDGQAVRAELSLLNEFSSGYFTGFFEKIIIVGNGDWKPLSSLDDPSLDDKGPEFEIKINRK